MGPIGASAVGWVDGFGARSMSGRGFADNWVRMGESGGINVHAEVAWSPPHRATGLGSSAPAATCRPPVAQGRLEYMARSKLRDSWMKTWRDGTVAFST